MIRYLIINKKNKKIVFTTQFETPSQAYYYLLLKNADKFYDKEWFYHLNNISKDGFINKMKTELKPHKHIEEIKFLFQTHKIFNIYQKIPYGTLLQDEYCLLEINLENIVY